MKLHQTIAMTLSLLQYPLYASNIEYKLDFGLIIQNEMGEPVGFEKTHKIPIFYQGKTSLYGLVVTSPESDDFILSSIHKLPIQDNQQTKIMGKPMIVQKRGAIFLKTDFDDTPGEYVMEVYIDNKLHQTINYVLLPIDNYTKL